ncbi:hypothetical protein C8Q77DRAFT_1131555 [Trametes polyzona]|nr:hypothetical protein C8Q77DRAFT_1131555 [Trametes polyzona]
MSYETYSLEDIARSQGFHLHPDDIAPDQALSITRPSFGGIGHQAGQPHARDDSIATTPELLLEPTDWSAMFKFNEAPLPQSHWLEAPTDSRAMLLSAYAHTDNDSSTTPSPTSPNSVASDDTLVDMEAFLPNKEGDCHNVPQFTFSFEVPRPQPEVGQSVMYSSPSMDSHGPRACSFANPIDLRGQPQQQHLQGAVASLACEGMNGSSDNSFVPLTRQNEPTSPSETVVPSEHDTIAVASRRIPSSDCSKPAKRRKRQSTEKVLICPHCGSGWARTNNLQTHIKSVHLQMRPHVCPVPSCTRAFSRKHDLKRHYQSDHTDGPSPRRKTVKQGVTI